MRKRRVGVTARLRQTVIDLVTGRQQVATEMAAPPELRTPMGTAAEAALRVRMEVWRQWRASQFGGGPFDHPWNREQTMKLWDGALEARTRRCLVLRHGASPLRPPAPISFFFIIRKRGKLSRVRKPRKLRAPLTASLSSEEFAQTRKWGPAGAGAFSCLPLVGPPQPRLPAAKNLLDRTGLLMEAATVRERLPRTLFHHPAGVLRFPNVTLSPTGL